MLLKRLALFVMLSFMANITFAQFQDSGDDSDDSYDSSDDLYGSSDGGEDIYGGAEDYQVEAELPPEWENPQYSEPIYGKDWTELTEAEKQERFTGVDEEDWKDGINPHSVRPIAYSDQMLKYTVWRQLNLKDRANLGFYSKNQTLFDLIRKGIIDGSLRVFSNDSLTTTMERTIALEKVMDQTYGIPFEPYKIYILTLREDVIFDRKRSRLYYDIQSLQFFIPPDISPKGIFDPLFVLRYKDLVEFFEDQPNANWFNTQNNAEHRSFADAFDLRLFSSRIEKISNPQDEGLDEVYGNQDNLYEAYKKEQWLVDKESVLWSY